ncbi:hypothetical protein [Francisella adeliensis]|uniref:Uncharacterized protein n=1 Tax=Francisella adeliensis TaxID=2007306 RepID=A0A2Z4Y0G9_9GAMM|nr:hypothetical protein [Francisella adeliensis]AXA34661.1 hypothetical protein CDH04_09735 [Francisella adeliensis]MBK2086389.1 hypothetical protein [Francisella adeliensis]MBK2096604.1 hypothetical protein [Francisella adeliensis]QIW12905.1 hypothetical protein FZC43_09745 [Francisella adeliensis]QIW14781.1 hypothetical protein FZC44_09735 [Francisella adeliensis]
MLEKLYNWVNGAAQSRETININGHPFSFCYAIISNEYPLVFGYYEKPNIQGKKPRLWYKSSSESMWRAHVGFRCQIRGKPTTGFMKGDELAK